MWRALLGQVAGSALGSPGGGGTQTSSTKEYSKTTTLDKELQDLLEAVTANQVSKAVTSGASGTAQYSKQAAGADSLAVINAFASDPQLQSMLPKLDAKGYSADAKGKLAGDMEDQLATAAGVAGTKNAAVYASLLQAIKSSDVTAAMALLEANKGVETTAARSTDVNKSTYTDPSGIIGMVHNIWNAEGKWNLFDTSGLVRKAAGVEGNKNYARNTSLPENPLKGNG